MIRFFAQMPTFAQALAVSALLGTPGMAFAQGCGGLQNDYGPYDYTALSSRQQLPGKGQGTTRLSLIEERYFQAPSESLSRFDRNGEPDFAAVISDLDNTLRAFPNHHRALYSVIKLELQQGRLPQLRGWRWYRSVDCYFERAVQLAPSDPVIFMLRGLYLHRRGKLNSALGAYSKAERINPEVADLQYNLGLLHLDLGDYPQAKIHAEHAYRLQHRQPGLRRRLAELGHWP